MPTEPVIQIGPYISGEIPDPLVVIFEDSTGARIDLTGYTTPQWITRRHLVSSGFAFTGTDPAAVVRTAVINADQTWNGTTGHRGEVTYTWILADMAINGDYEAEAWCTAPSGAPVRAAGRYAYHVALTVVNPTGVIIAGDGSTSVQSLTVTAGSSLQGKVTLGADVVHASQTVTEAVLVSGVNAALSEDIYVTLTAARVMGLPLNGVAGDRLHLIITEGGAGGFALTFVAGISVTNWTMNLTAGAKTEAWLTCLSPTSWVLALNPTSALAATVTQASNFALGFKTQVGTEMGASGGLANGLVEIVQQISQLNNQHDLILLAGGTVDVHIGHKASYVVATVTQAGVGVTTIQVDSTASMLATQTVDIGANTGKAVLAVVDATHFTVAAPITVNNSDSVTLYSTGQLCLDMDVRILDLTNQPGGHRAHGLQFIDTGSNVLIEFSYTGGTILRTAVEIGNNGANKNLLFRNGSAAGVVQVANAANNLAILSLTDAGALLITDLLTAGQGATINGRYLQLAGSAGGQSIQFTNTTAVDLVLGGGAAVPFRIWNSGYAAALLVVPQTGQVSAPNGYITATGDISITAGRLVLGATASKIVPGATSLSHRNNADSADNLLITDVGNVTTRGTLNIGSRPAFAASDKYLVVDASGNVHVSSLGPAS